ncbi:MAG: ImmA/IrrE family metallo-endopeptidase [Gammaproteobacteria bacterium]|jgi:Zn-dependent peptidase ImmA (M78 family)|nr:ImmA/IrrE family metallo-endopeptidase [Gammaproteobacteria bacterium]
MAGPQVLTDPLIIGGADGLRCVLSWRNDYGTSGPIARTWGNLQLWIRDTLVWGDPAGKGGLPHGIRWSWIDLLEFLAVAWPYLEEEETHPIAFDTPFEAPQHLGELRGRATLRWRNVTDDQAEDEQERLEDFLLVHDLGEALQGAFAPSLTLLRQGHQMRAATKAREWILTYTDCMSTLRSLAEQIAERLRGLDDARSKLALERWQTRDQLAPVSRLEAATGLAQHTLEEVWPGPINDANVPYTLKAAARMAGTYLPADALSLLLADLTNIPVGSSTRLNHPRQLAAELMTEYPEDEPYIQGYQLASHLRRTLNLGDDWIDPEKLLIDWGVAVKDIELPSEELDAIAVWSASHRPTVFINTLGLRSRFATGRRVSLAHEICHLLVDTDGALPAVEVFGGRVPPDVEKRANAFAAELLLPRSKARDVTKQHLQFVNTADARQSAVEEALNELAAQFSVSHETAAWQVKNSGALPEKYDDILKPYLKSLWQPN